MYSVFERNGVVYLSSAGSVIAAVSDPTTHVSDGNQWLLQARLGDEREGVSPPVQTAAENVGANTALEAERKRFDQLEAENADLKDRLDRLESMLMGDAEPAGEQE